MAIQNSKEFYSNFINVIAGPALADEEEFDRRVKFMLHNYNMVPKDHRELIFSLTRSFPTPPIYAYLMIGILGTNIARYCAIARPGCHNEQWERSGAFYNLIAESRLGKGIAMKLLRKLGGHIQKIRRNRFPNEVDGSTERPRHVFLPGEN